MHLTSPRLALRSFRCVTLAFLVCSIGVPGIARASAAEAAPVAPSAGFQADAPRAARLTPTAASRRSGIDALRYPSLVVAGGGLLVVGTMIAVFGTALSLVLIPRNTLGGALATGLGTSAFFLVPGAVLAAIGAQPAFPAAPASAPAAAPL